MWRIGELLTTFTVAALTVAAGHLVPFPLILAVVAVVGVVGCFKSTLPRGEYLVIMGILVTLAGVGYQYAPWILAVPGLAAGYMWGSVVADRLDEPNVARMQAEAVAEAKESEKTGD